MSAPRRNRGRLLGDDLDSRVVVGDSNMPDAAIGIGAVRNGGRAGKMNAKYAFVDLTGITDLANVNVSHRLGVPPSLCELVEVSNAGSVAAAVVAPVGKPSWSRTNCKVAVTLLNGTPQAGTVLKFRVGGQ